MDLEDLSCAICQEPFDAEERTPRMLPCGHTYCQRCLEGLFTRPPLLCPEDRSAISVAAVADLAKNFALLKVIQKKHDVKPKAEESGKCAEHRKKLEYVCLDDRIRICANCALFGKHRGHNVKPEEDIMREITIRAECLFDMLQIIERSQATVLDDQVKQRLEELYERYHKRKSDLEAQLLQCFQGARSKLAEMEKSAQMTLQKNFDYIEDNFVNIRDMPKLIDAQASAWIFSAKEKLDRLSSASEDPNYVALEVLESSSNDLFQTGEKVLLELEGLKDLPVSSLEELVQGVTIEYSEALLNGLIRVKSGPKQPQLAQMSELRTSLNPEVSKVEHPGEEPARKSISRKPQSDTIFEEAMDALRLHTMEVADFTGAGAQIPQLLTGNCCLKSLKFCKNLLPDAVIEGIASVLQDNTTLQSLHIVQNPMSTGSMDTLLDMLSLNTTLREINLSGNPKMTHEYKSQFSAQSNRYRKVYT